MAKAPSTPRVAVSASKRARKPRTASPQKKAAEVQLQGSMPDACEPWGLMRPDESTEADADFAQDSEGPVPSAEELAQREQLTRLLLPVLREHLSVQVEPGDFTSPNNRIIRVLFKDECISEGTFDVSARPEYEG